MTVGKRLAIAVLAAIAIPLDSAGASQPSFDRRLFYVAAPVERNLAEFWIPDDDHGPRLLRVHRLGEQGS